MIRGFGEFVNIIVPTGRVRDELGKEWYDQPMNNITTQHDKQVKDYLGSVNDEQTVKDSQVLIEIMQKISGHEPKLGNVGTIGFDTYHYKYDSGREGDGQIISFYPRKGKITIYLMDGTARYTVTGYCLYIKQLSDIELPILERILQESYTYVKSQDGQVHGILWKAKK